jgi:hypothetical protein
MADQKWKLSARSGNPITILSTGLDALGNSSAALSAAINNDTDLDLFVDLELIVTFASPPAANFLVRAYLARTTDGSNYEDATAGASPLTPRNGLVGSFIVRNVTTIQRMVIPLIELPPRAFKVQLVNETGVAFPASGSVLRGLFYKYQSA